MARVLFLAWLQIALLLPGSCPATDLYQLGLSVIPYPQEVKLAGENFTFSGPVVIVIDKSASKADKFTADELSRNLKKDFGIIASVGARRSASSIVLSLRGAEQRLGQQGYQLSVSPGQLLIRANGSPGLFYGTQTLLQLIQKSNNTCQIPGLMISDWPDVKVRAVHYDTKHHQDKKEYVESFIRDLARYKVNMMVWEWEDKLGYTSHPEVAAPGAFTIGEMQAFTTFARQYHIELVPLVQGLGHVSFILKWPQYAALREIPSSNWEFCPLKDDSYKLLFDLWREAIAATPGSGYIHIGSDETYEVAQCPACKAKAAEIGVSGVYLLFVNKASAYLKSLGRKVMVWEPPMGWEQHRSPAAGITPDKGLVLTESYGYERADFMYAKKAKALGFSVYAYDPNPGIEHLFLPYFFRDEDGKKSTGCLEESRQFLKSVSSAGAFDGMISTSWDDSGLHNQVWMLRFATAAAFSWNGNEPEAEEFTASFFRNYYGATAVHLDELFQLFNEGALYYMSTFERNVWHHGDIGKTHLPDLPRGDALEYDPFWNREYKEMIARSGEMAGKMERAVQIIEENIHSGAKNLYDFEVYYSIARLIWHTAKTYEDLAAIENLIGLAHKKHFEDHLTAYQHLQEARSRIESSLERRKNIFNNLVSTWEKTRLPKGMSTEEKKYFFQQDRARHFANRRPDMSYLIYDEQQLGLEEYLASLMDYMDYYNETFCEKQK